MSQQNHRRALEIEIDDIESITLDEDDIKARIAEQRGRKGICIVCDAKIEGSIEALPDSIRAEFNANRDRLGDFAQWHPDKWLRKCELFNQGLTTMCATCCALGILD